MSTVTVRYFVTDLDTAVAFYTEQLDFEVELRPSPEFAMLYRGDLQLLLTVPGGAGGGAAMPDGARPGPGGWNRFTVQVEDLVAAVERLRGNGCRFRNDVVTGIGVKQILLLDPDDNLIELFEPIPAAYHERT